MASQLFADATLDPEGQTPTSNGSIPAEPSSAPAATGKPADLVTDKLPSEKTQHKVEQHTVLDRQGKAQPFKSIYSGPESATRVLVIFVRHFFCGNCQEFLRALSASIKPDALSRLTTSTSIAIIGCGDPGLIDTYAAETECPFPIFADPTRKLYDDLGMITSYALGARPEYIRKSIVRGVVDGIVQALKQVPRGLATKSGDPRQIGGEFLFEPSGTGEEKRVTWCHRMQTTRDHTEVADLTRILDPDGQGQLQKT